MKIMSRLTEWLYMVVPRRNAFDVEVWKRDVDPLVILSIEEVVALRIPWIETWKVG